jgi:hypothetical protein
VGHERGQGIYVLAQDVVPRGLAAACLSSVSTSSCLLWHKRLGHPSLWQLRESLP